MEVNVERSAKDRARPCQRNEADVGVVKVGGEVGIGGKRRLRRTRRREVVTVVGCGRWAEARRERGRER